MKPVFALAVLAGLAVSAGSGHAELYHSPFAIDLLARADTSRLVSDVDPSLLLAQRVLEREWTTRADSLVNPNYLAGGKSEMGAMAMSAAVPGSGQLYVGERSGFAYLAAEIATVAGAIVLHHKANDYRTDAARVAGAPDDSTSAWSFDRWAAATKSDPSEIEALYQVDRESFYQRIGDDPAYAAGWSSNNAHDTFTNWRDVSDKRLRTAHAVTVLTWINHLVASVDALRAARFYNLPMRRGIELKAKANWKHNGPSLRLALVRKF